MGLLDGLINRLFKTGQGATASGEDPAALVSPRAAIRLVGATITDVPDYNRIDVEYPTPLALSSATPAANSGAGSAGVATTAARGDHVHPASGGSADLDPAGTLTLAGATSTAVRIGDDSPSHRPSFSAWTGPFAVNSDDNISLSSSNGTLTISAINTSLWSLEELQLDCSNQLYLTGFFVSLSETSAGEHHVRVTSTGVEVESDEGLTVRDLGYAGGTGATLTGVALAFATTGTISGTTCALQGSTACQIVGPTIVIGAGLTTARHTFSSPATSAVRTVTDAANATALTETCAAASSTIAAVGTLTLSGTAASVIASTGDVVLRATASGGEVEVQIDGSTVRHRFSRNYLYSNVHGARPISIGAFNNDPAAEASAIYMGATETGSPSSSNYTFLGGNGHAYLNAPSQSIHLQLAGSLEPLLLSTSGIKATTPRIEVVNSTAVPGSNPTGGGYLYAEGGALKWRGSSGTVTTIAPA